jgi:hypothetical protein
MDKMLKQLDKKLGMQTKAKSPEFSPHQGCQIFLGQNIPKLKNIPNDHKLYQTTINYTKWP